jgi:hypothetical protein
MAELQEPHRLILTLCSADQPGLWFVIPHIKDFYRGDDTNAIRTKTLEVVKNLLKAELISAGQPAQDGRSFVPWTGVVDTAVERIRKEWDALGHEPSIGDIVWFAATPAGNRLLAQLKG